MIKITNAQFIISAADKKQFIKSEKPVIAVCGKSNRSEEHTSELQSR